MTTGQLPWHCTLCPSERLLLHLLRPKVHHALNPLQFAYQDKVGVKDAILYLLHSSRCFLDKGNGVVRIMFFYFSSAFNTIQPLLLSEKLADMGVDQHMVKKRLPHQETSVCQAEYLFLWHGDQQVIIAIILLFAVVCWGYGIKKKDAMWLNKLDSKAGSVVGLQLDPLTTVAI